jgi:L-threonylcarbamoyladenylate synthase
MSIIQPRDIQLAMQSLNQGDIVAIPTETVYGLAGQIDKPEALEKIFRIKQRPFFDPLIVHVESSVQAKSLTSEWSPMAQFLSENFWPGPLTLVLPKASHVNSLITSGLETVGIRCPRHPLTLSLLRSVDAPLAAPSANRFGRTSPTEASHVEKEFEKENILILDGGPCEVGIESTVLKLEKNGDDYKLFILRKGLVTQQVLEEKLKTSDLTYLFIEPENTSASPGHLEHHYMPPIPLIYCSQAGWDLARLKQHLKEKNLFYGMDLNIGTLELPSEAPLAARKLYAEMRRLSELDHKALVFFHSAEQKSEAWQAILDRLYRAAKIKI